MSRLVQTPGMIEKRAAANRAAESAVRTKSYGPTNDDAYINAYIKSILPPGTKATYPDSLIEAVTRQAKMDYAVFAEDGTLLLDELASAIYAHENNDDYRALISNKLKDFNDDMLTLANERADYMRDEESYYRKYGFDSAIFRILTDLIDAEVERRAKKHANFKIKMQGQLAGLCSTVTAMADTAIVEQLKRMLAEAEKELPDAKRLRA